MNNTPTPSITNNNLVDKTREFLKTRGIVVNTSGPSGTVNIKGINNLLDALLAKGLISLEQFNSIKFESVNTNKTVEQIIKDHELLSENEIVKTYAEMRGVPFIELNNLIINSDVLNKIPANMAKSALAIAFEETPTIMKVGMKDPLDLQKIKYLEAIIGKRIEPYFATEEDINHVIDSKYGAQLGKEVNEALEDVGEDTLVNIDGSYVDRELSQEQDLDSAPIIKIVNMILDYGIKHKASDVHIEAREKRIGIRFRVRGLLSEKLTLPRKLLSPLVSRIKILSNLKIDEHRIPQDGRFQAKSGSELVDIRVSIMPSIYGEKIVMRLLPKTQSILNLSELGISGLSFSRMPEALKKTQGIILVTGPTGSGKTQTLASCLKLLNSPDVNITTLEDPVEIRVDGVNQVQVNAEVGLTFANGLRSFLRQDPDIIMVGEIRDSETANLAVQAALVGRLVLSTIHTNSAAGAFIRMMDMGVEPFLLSSTVNIVIGQRLVRVLCDNCKQPYSAPPEVVQELHKELDPLGAINIYTSDQKVKLHFDATTTDVTLYKPVGCPKCNDTGYMSRMGIFEVLKMSENISAAVIAHATISDIQTIAIKEGMITMIKDGFIKTLEGLTTVEEVLRVKNE